MAANRALAGARRAAAVWLPIDPGRRLDGGVDFGYYSYDGGSHASPYAGCA
jgi:hypothetical protein